MELNCIRQKSALLLESVLGQGGGVMPFESDFRPEATIENEVIEPRMYRVLLHNDDYTTMEFVVQILMQVFHKNAEEATAIMLNVHKNGLGVAGVYPYELAEIKVKRTHYLARQAEYPLRCTIEETGE